MIFVRRIVSALVLAAGLVVQVEMASALRQATVPTGRALFTSTTSDGDSCPDEDAACDEDVVCLACKASYTTSFGDCTASLSSPTCDEYEEALCCASEGCTSNEAFVDFIGCVNESVGCGLLDMGECSSSPPSAAMGGALAIAAMLLAAMAAPRLARV
ncbi:unnamed protein product [Scytosiphon promiscuus]